MKKRVLTTLMVVTVLGAALTGCGASQAQKGENIEPVALQTMAKSTEGAVIEVTENVVVDETSTKEEAKTDIATEDTKDVTIAVPTTEAVPASKEAAVEDKEEKKQESTTKKEAKEQMPEESDEVDEEPYFGEIGNIDNLKVTIGDSDLYTKEELQSAVGYILGKFQVDFTDCEMTKLNYDEALSLSQSKVWADQYGADEAIVFTSTFNTTENYRELNMEPGQVCEGYNWILTRNEGEDWTLQTWGY